MKREIKNSRIIVTGASSGIGRAVSLQLAREGAKLLVVARRQDRLSQLAEEAAAGDDFRANTFREAREAETFGAAHGLLAHRDDGGTTRTNF